MLRQAQQGNGTSNCDFRNLKNTANKKIFFNRLIMKTNVSLSLSKTLLKCLNKPFPELSRRAQQSCLTHSCNFHYLNKTKIIIFSKQTMMKTNVSLSLSKTNRYALFYQRSDFFIH